MPRPDPPVASRSGGPDRRVLPGRDRAADIHADAGRPDRAERAAGRIPLGRPGEPEEIAPAIAFLLGPDAAYVTGILVRVAGGL